MNNPLRAAVIGTGRMGRHHARLYGQMPQTELVAVVDANLERASAVAAEFGGRALADVSEVLDELQVVTIAVPTVKHFEVAKPLIERRIPVLIEKPLAPSVEQARELLALAKTYDTLVAVGHVERYNPVVRALKRMEIVPKFVETHRISPFTFRSADIGVVSDMMIHDIDIVLHLVRDTPVSIDAVGINVLGPNEDIANARVRFTGGCVANLTASRLALKTERKIRVFSEEAYLSLDYQKRSGIAVKKDANLDLLKMAREMNAEDLSQMQGADFGSLVKVEPLVIDDTEPLRAELEAFIRAVQTGEPLAVSTEEGVAAVQLAADITASLKAHCWDGSPTGRIGLADDMLRPRG
ncbi:MAG: Gfo/Idh/MocA family oxidoreductase [Phycisphaerae bacterium]|nr:Gfo/Idh/MocA family oxidoreductase [Phycisphaerae bacterium]